MITRRDRKEKNTLAKPFPTLGTNPFSCCVINRGFWWYNFEWGLCICAGGKMDIREYNKGPCTMFSPELPVAS